MLHLSEQGYRIFDQVNGWENGLPKPVKEFMPGGLTSTEPHIKNFLECIKSRKPPICDVAIGHRSATVCHLGNIARYTGRKLKWDPVREIFPDDTEANTYLDRPRRKPWELPKSV